LYHTFTLILFLKKKNTLLIYLNFMKKVTFLLFALLFFNSISAQKSLKKDSINIVIPIQSGKLFGTLISPTINKKLPLVIIIAGSGPTDRNGNQQGMFTNAYKLMADDLFIQNIATFRYDKRMIGESKGINTKEEDLRFDDYIDDVVTIINFFKNEQKFSKIIVAGHSEGSLLAMVAIQKSSVNGYISLAGAGQSADKILKEQLKNQPEPFKSEAFSTIDSLVEGKKVENIKYSSMLFRKSVQPYIISWLKYDPQKEIKKIQIPILIIQGTTDLQVSLNDAQNLYKAQPKAELFIIEGMNHILKNAEADRQKNILTYNNPSLPLSTTLINKISSFVNQLK